MAKKRSSNDTSPRLKLDYQEYMNLYGRQKKQRGPNPAENDDAHSPDGSAFELSEETPSQNQSAQGEDLTPASYESAQMDDTEEAIRASTYKEERLSAPELDGDEDREGSYDDDPDALDIQNPFMDMFHRAKHLTKKASDYMNTKKSADDIETLYFDEEEEDEEETDEHMDGASGWTRFLARIGFKPLGDEDLSEEELQRKYKNLKAVSSDRGLYSESYHQSFEANTGDVKVVEEIDPVFTMDSEFSEEISKIPAGRTDRRDSRKKTADEAPPIMVKQRDRTYRIHDDEKKEKNLNGEGVDVMAGDQNNSNNARYNDMLGYDTNETPSMSRRERKARETPGRETSTKKYPQAKPEPKLPAYDDMPVDEPTQEFKPVRVRPDHRSKESAPEPYYDDYDDYDEADDAPAETPASNKRKQRVYSDYDDEYEQDEYDDDYDDEYEDHDYDEEDDDDDQRNSLGHHILGFLKALFAIIIILIVLLLALRLLENANIVSLDAVRNSIGKYVPIEVILPKPEDSSATPESTQLPSDTQDNPAGDVNQNDALDPSGDLNNDPEQGDALDPSDDGTDNQGDNGSVG